MRLPSLRPPLGRQPRPIVASLVAAAVLAGSTVVIAVVQQAGIPSAAPVYLLAVLAVGIFAGTLPAVVTSVAAFLLYDFLFVQPLYTFTVSDPNEWLNLLLLLVVALAIGQLAALEARRAEEAAERAEEAQAMFRVSRALATSQSLPEAARDVLGQLLGAMTMDRVWLGLGASSGEERIVADTGSGPAPVGAFQVVLNRAPGDEPARWVRAHVAGGRERRRAGGGAIVYRVRLQVPGEVLGSLWLARSREERDPDRAETRIVAAAADQLGQAVRRDRLVAEALDAEIARRSESLKSALLDSVSHDLRTPLASIRAAAGSLLDADVEWTPAERREALASIDAEAERMNRLVRNLLDLSRIEGGALRPELEPHDLDELVGPVIRRIAPGREIRLDLPADLPPVLVDDTYFEEVLTNLVENAIRYGGPTIVVRAVADPIDGTVQVVVEDDGQGVPSADLGHLFEKFYRVRRAGEGSRRGMGIGLSVARGLLLAMDGEIEAVPSPLGGLAMRIRLPASSLPPEPDATSPLPVPAQGGGVDAGRPIP